jgi:cephamycin C biosynthesis protein
METVSTILYYSTALTPGGREDNWQYDAVSQPPDVLCNFRTVGTKVEVFDLRTMGLNPQLDTWGFEKHSFPTAVDQRDLSNSLPEAIEAYGRETTSYLKAVLQAEDVVLFDTVVRHEDTEVAAKPSGSPFVGPYMRVHVDQNPRSAAARLEHHVGSCPGLRRFQILNIWRPLIQPVKNYPLALCDYQSLDPQVDLVTTRRILPEWMHKLWVQDREGYSLKHRACHRWYYWRSLTPEECLVFQRHDSASRSLALCEASHEARIQQTPDRQQCNLLDVAGLCPHTAFFDPQGPAKGHLRSSLDVRVLVLYT